MTFMPSGAFNFTHISALGNQDAVKSGPGILHSVTINTKGASDWTTLNATTLATPSSSIAPKPAAKTTSQSILASSNTSTADETTTVPVPAVAAPAPEPVATSQPTPNTNNSNITTSSFNFAWLLVIPGGIVLIWAGIAIFAKLRP